VNVTAAPRRFPIRLMGGIALNRRAARETVPSDMSDLRDVDLDHAATTRPKGFKLQVLLDEFLGV